MKKLLMILMFVPLVSLGQNNSALLGMNFGMTKKEIKKEFKTNKKKYTKVLLGGYFWRHYYQNNSYDEKGGMTLMKLNPVGGGLYGLSEVQSRLVFKDLVRLLVAQGYKNDSINTKNKNPLEFVIGETYIFFHKEKGKNIYVGLPPSPTTKGNIYLNLVIGRYSAEIDYSDSAL
tara:strand:+ start:93 stop:614 length:522 start_codon:yes stop_codon:yes gene_type:complete